MASGLLHYSAEAAHKSSGGFDFNEKASVTLDFGSVDSGPGRGHVVDGAVAGSSADFSAIIATFGYAALNSAVGSAADHAAAAA